MFEIRLKVLLFMMLFGLAIVIARLADMQLLHADTYRRQAEEALLLPVKVLPTVRGRILDRLGVELVADEPCWDIRVAYGVLAMEPAYLKARLWRFRRKHGIGKEVPDEVVAQRLRVEIGRMWDALSAISGESVATLRERAAGICARIQTIRREVSSRRGFDADIREQRMSHAVVSGLDDQQQVNARATLTEYPWVSVENSNRRVYRDGLSMAHVLGRLGSVTAKDLAHDPFADDPARAYLSNERLGVGGVERSAEALLRGRRGRFQRSRDGTIITDEPAAPGRDIHLTLRRDLQDRLFAMFARKSDALPEHPGGAIVVLDVATRDCLALISYPSYDPGLFRESYSAWRRDTRRQPLRFRAVANRYAPGSIIKPLACVAGLNTGAIDLSTHFVCSGSLFPNHPDRFRCWADRTGRRMHHGSLDVAGAIKHSCNIFMYHVGERVGVRGLCEYFEMVGFGQLTGTGLVEENPGINPTPSWLAEKRGISATPGLARQFAIGQAQVSVTPLQAANLMAIYASGERRNVTLVKELADDRSWPLPGDASSWAAIRRGLYGVVNDSDGTAHRTAYIKPTNGWVLCGKTGSAQANPWPITFAVPYVTEADEEGVAIVPATTRADAEHDFMAEHKTWAFDRREIRIHERLPLPPLAPGRSYSHAWFAGYLQPVTAGGQLDHSRQPRIAFAVMVEFGGSGGRVSGPIGREVARILLEMLGPQLDPDAPAALAEKGER